MKNYSSFKVFSLVYGIWYIASFHFVSVYPEAWWTAIFRFYPATGGWSVDRLPLAEAGPAILWYAWVAAAFIVAAVAALIVPRSLADRIPTNWLWFVPTALTAFILIYEKSWFGF